MIIYINNTKPISVHQRKNWSIWQARWCFKAEYFLIFKVEQARWKLGIVNLTLTFPSSTTNFFFPWLFNIPSKPKAWQVLFTIFSNLPEYIHKNIYSYQETQMQSKFAHKVCFKWHTEHFKTLEDTHDIGATSAPPTSLSFCHCCGYTSDFALRNLVDLEVFAQNLLTQLFYFLKVWSRQKGQGQYMQSMSFLGFFGYKKRKMLFLFFC